MNQSSLFGFVSSRSASTIDHVSLPSRDPSDSATNLPTPESNDATMQAIPIPRVSSEKKGRHFREEWKIKYGWLEYDTTYEAAFCIICKDPDDNGMLHMVRNKEKTFITPAYTNWKKALERLGNHEKTDCHKQAVYAKCNATTSSIHDQLNNEASLAKSRGRRCLMKIFTSLKFLAAQGLAIRGHEEIDSNFRQLIALRAEDDEELKKWIAKDYGKKYTRLSHDISNEILEMFAHNVMRMIAKKLRDRPFYAIIVDETTDTSVCEQVSNNKIRGHLHGYKRRNPEAGAGYS